MICKRWGNGKTTTKLRSTWSTLSLASHWSRAKLAYVTWNYLSSKYWRILNMVVLALTASEQAPGPTNHGIQQQRRSTYLKLKLAAHFNVLSAWTWKKLQKLARGKNRMGSAALSSSSTALAHVKNVHLRDTSDGRFRNTWKPPKLLTTMTMSTTMTTTTMKATKTMSTNATRTTTTTAAIWTTTTT